MERETGIEPATSSLGSWHSTSELLPHALKDIAEGDALSTEKYNHASDINLLKIGHSPPLPHPAGGDGGALFHHLTVH